MLDALYELLRGFQAADERAQGGLLMEAPVGNPDRVYAGRFNGLLRLVFLNREESVALALIRGIQQAGDDSGKGRDV